MAQRRGPGRRFSGPKINASSNIPIPNDLIENEIIKTLTTGEIQTWNNLSREVKETFINGIKKNLLTVTGKQEADTSLLLLGELGDLKGVNIAISYEDLYKDPVGTLKKLPGNIWGQIIEYADIERELERKVLSNVMATGQVNGDPTDEHPLLKGSKIFRVDPANNKILGGIDGVKHYAGLASKINGWVDNSQAQGKRDGNRDQVVTEVHNILAREYLSKGNSDILNNSKQSITPLVTYGTARAGDILNKSNGIDSELMDRINADSEARRIFRGFSTLPEYQKSLSRTVSKDRNGKKIDLQYFLVHEYRDSRLGNRVFAGDSTDLDVSLFRQNQLGSFFGKINTSNGPFSKLKELIDDPTNPLGLENPATLSNALGGLNGEKVGDALGKMSGMITSPSSGIVPRDVSRMRSIITSSQSAASKTQKIISDHIEKELTYHAHETVDRLIDGLVGIPPARKDQVKSRLKSAMNLKRYVQIRNDMENMQEFFKAASKGNVLKSYFIIGRYNQFMPEIVQQINTKLMNTPIFPNGATIEDYLGGKGKITKMIRNVEQSIGFAGGPSEKAGLIGGFSNERTMYQVEFSYSDDFKRNVTIGGKKLDLYDNPETYNHLSTIEHNFEHNALGSWKMGEITVYAADFSSLPTFADFAQKYAVLPGTNLNTLKAEFHTFMQNPGLISSSTIFNTFTTAEKAKYVSAIEDLVGVLKTKYTSVDPVNTFDFLSDIAFHEQKAFVKNGNLVRYLPLLNKLATRLSYYQNLLFDALEKKILNQTILKFGPFRWAYNTFYNPKYGPVKVAENLVIKYRGLFTRIGNSGAVKLISKLGIQKLLPSFLTSATAGTAYLAIVIARLGSSVAKGLWGALKGDFGRIFRELKYAFNDLIVAPIKFIGKFVYYIAGGLFGLALFIVIFIAGLGGLGQPYRDVAVGGFGIIDSSLPIFYNPDGSSCVIRGSADGGPLVNKIGSPFGGDTTYPVTSCPGNRPCLGRGGVCFHGGVDLGTSGTTPPLYNPYSGTATVTFAGWSTAGYGNLVILSFTEGGNTYNLYFAHLSSFAVSQGQTVASGGKIGNVGTTGNSTGEHLHFEVRQGSSGLLSACYINSAICSNQCVSDNFGGAVCTD